MNIPAIAHNTLGKISIFTDATIYRANQLAHFKSTSINLGKLDADFTVQLILEDMNHNVVQLFESVHLGMVSPGVTVEVMQDWNTKIFLNAVYLLKAILYDKNGNIVDQSSTSFTIVSDSGITELSSLRIETNKPLYHTTDSVYLDELVQNLSVNFIISGASLNLSVKHATNNTEVYNAFIELNDLVPQSMKTLYNSFELINATEGNYIVTGEIISQSGEVLADASTSFDVASTLSKALKGSVSVDYPIIEYGETQRCIDTLNNIGAVDIADKQLRQLLVNIDTNQSASQNTLSLTLDINATKNFERFVDTTSLTEGNYACILQAQDANTWQTLGYANFLLKEPPIRLDVNISSGSHGRLLILLDNAYCEPNGPNGVVTPSQQRSYLEMLLDRNGYSYTIVTNKIAFTTEFRSGTYNAYVVMSEVPKLSKRLQLEIAEALYRGEGLLISGKHNKRNGRLDALAGVAYKGKFATIDSIELNTTLYALNLTDDKLHVVTNETEILASFNDLQSAAITLKEHYRANAIFSAFDLLLYAAEFGGEYEDLLLNLLEMIQSDSYTAEVDRVLPVTMTIKNLGIPIAGESVTIHYNADAEIVDSGEGTLDEDGTLYWNFNLLESNSTTLSLFGYCQKRREYWT